MNFFIVLSYSRNATFLNDDIELNPGSLSNHNSHSHIEVKFVRGGTCNNEEKNILYVINKKIANTTKRN